MLPNSLVFQFNIYYLFSLAPPLIEKTQIDWGRTGDQTCDSSLPGKCTTKGNIGSALAWKTGIMGPIPSSGQSTYVFQSQYFSSPKFPAAYTVNEVMYGNLKNQTLEFKFLSQSWVVIPPGRG